MLQHSKKKTSPVQQKNQPPHLGGPHHGNESCCTNDGLSSTRGLRGSSDLGGILRGEENLVTPTTPVRVAKPDLHSCYWGVTPTDPKL